MEEPLMHWDLFDTENYELKKSILSKALLRFEAWQLKTPLKRTLTSKLFKVRLCVKAECKRERIALPANYTKQVLEDLRELWVNLRYLRGDKQVDRIIGVLNSIT